MKVAIADSARLFFAVWPSPEVQRALGALAAALRRECGGRAVPADNIHLTLAFLGGVERGRLPAIEALAGAVSAPRFDLSVTRVQYWAHNRIVWAGVERCPEALSGLAEALARALAEQGFRLERRPYVPHITLLRDARRAPASGAVPPVAWPVEQFALVESVPHGGARRYEVLRRWALAPGERL
ncbi:MAG TPA: RNA 2',3'-cyclic phosphodiesterase [Burkholderiales bacterium]|nr:RNA 2',3'-cyclic phosphodiesterase [Burkholderiales bacterium]